MSDGTLAKVTSIHHLAGCKRQQNVLTVSQSFREDHIIGASVIAGIKAIDRSKDSGSSGELLAGISLTEQFV